MKWQPYILLSLLLSLSCIAFQIDSGITFDTNTTHWTNLNTWFPSELNMTPQGFILNNTQNVNISTIYTNGTLIGVPTPTYFWAFDEGAGAIATDIVRNKVMDLNGGVTWTNGINGSSVRFNSASSQYGNSSYLKNIEGINNFTINFWAKKNGTANADSFNYLGDGTTKARIQNYDCAGGGNYFERNSLSFNTQSGACNGNNWQMFTLVYNRSHVVGRINGTVKVNFSTATSITSTLGSLNLAKVGGTYYNGTIDNFGVWLNRSLTIEQIQTLGKNKYPFSTGTKQTNGTINVGIIKWDDNLQNNFTITGTNNQAHYLITYYGQPTTIFRNNIKQTNSMLASPVMAYWFFVTEGNVSVTIKKELTNNLLNDTNITIELLSLTNQSTVTTNTGRYTFSNLLAGEYQLTFSGANYSQRTYYLTVPITGMASMTAYLLPTASSEDFRVLTRDTGDLLIINATVTVTKKINNTVVVVGQRRTDIAGSVLLYLKPDDQYTIMGSKSGYISKQGSYIPRQEINCAQYGCVTLYLDNDNVGVGSSLDRLSQTNSIPNNILVKEGYTFETAISNPSGRLTSYALEITFHNVTYKKNYTSTTLGYSAYGGLIQVPVNFSNKTGSYRATLSFQQGTDPKVSESLYGAVIAYNQTATNATLSQTLTIMPQLWKTSTKIILSVIIILFILAWFYIDVGVPQKYLPLLAGLLISVMGYYGWLAKTQSASRILAGVYVLIIILSYIYKSRTSEGL